MLIDSHAHLTDERLAAETLALLARCREAGVEAVITVGTGPEDNALAAALARVHPMVYAAVGVHPHAAEQATPEALAEVERLAAEPRVVALGEMGLDYHYDNAPREVQRAAFARQLELAGRLDLPAVVHAREADDDVRAALREAGSGVRGVLHCFSSGAALLEEALELGWYASFSGMVTFSRYADVELLRRVPADRLLVETDSPYLAPVPNRGKRNEPAWVATVARRAAELRGEDANELAARTTENARRLFRLPAEPAH